MAEELSQHDWPQGSSSLGMSIPDVTPAMPQGSFSYIRPIPSRTNLFGRPYPYAGFYPLPVDSSDTMSASFRDPTVYVLMFATGSGYPLTHPFAPQGNPTMVCETEEQALHHLHLNVGWLAYLRAQVGKHARADVLFPDILASGRLNRGVLILKRGVTRGRAWTNWYVWWVEEMSVAA